MSKMRVQYDLVTSSMPDGEIIRLSVEDDLAARSVFDRPSPVTVSRAERGITFRVIGDIRFDQPADAQAVYSKIQSDWAGGLQGKILPGSQVSIHDCPHEEPSRNWTSCSVRSFARAVK